MLVGDFNLPTEKLSLNLVIGKFFPYGAPQFHGVEVIENLI